MPKRQVFPECCSLYVVTDISCTSVKEVLDVARDTGVPVVFVDNLLDINCRGGTEGFGKPKTLGGQALANGLRKEGYRVDDLVEFEGAHRGRPVRMWMWYTNKNSKDGKKPSRILYEQKDQVRNSKLGLAKRAGTYRSRL